MKTLATVGWRKRDPWTQNTEYRQDDRIPVKRGWMYATEDHVSSEDFEADVAAGKWEWLVDAQGLDEMEAVVEEAKETVAEGHEVNERAREAAVLAEDAAQVVNDFLIGIENDEFKYAIADKDGYVVFGIRHDGSTYMPKGIPDEVAALLDSLGFSVLQNDDFAFCIVDKNGYIVFGVDWHGCTHTQGLQGIITLEEFESPEFKFVMLDSAKNVLFGIKTDGTFYASKFELPPDIIKLIQQAANQHISDTENNVEFLHRIVDLAGYIVFGVKLDGSIYIAKGMSEDAKRKFGLIDDQIDSIKNDIADIKSRAMDWSNEAQIALPFPRGVARVDITGTFPADKYNAVPGVLTYRDVDGNTFTVNIAWNRQGNISAGFDKKNFSFDMLTPGGDEFAVRFGNWVPQDSFHLKAHYSDFWKTRALCVYRHAQQLIDSRPYYNRYPFDCIFGAAQQSVADALKGGIGDPIEDARDGAMCHPDGFPCMVYINNLPYGIYTWNLKKHKDNYRITKNDDTGKQIFIGDYMNGVFERYNTAYWQISNYDLCKIEGDGAARKIKMHSYSSSSGLNVVMGAAGVAGMTLSIERSDKTYEYPVKFNDKEISASNNWEAGDCVRFLRAGTSDAYYFNATVVAKKWQEGVAYPVNTYVYDEDTFNFEHTGKTSSITLRRLFKLAISNNTTFAGYEYDEDGYICQTVYATDPDTGEQITRRGGRITSYNTMKPLYVHWKQLEVRNPKTTITRMFAGNDDQGNPTYKYEYYDYDSPGDYAATGVYELTHEIISADQVTEKQITSQAATGATKNFSKKEYNRSVNARKTIDLYSRVIPILEMTMTARNLFDYGYLEGATEENFEEVYDAMSITDLQTIEFNMKKLIFAEHHDTDFNLDFFIVYNDCYYVDSITHNTLYTMYDGKKIFANLYDTDIALGMSSTYTNSFPAITSYQNVMAAGHTFVEFLWKYYADEIKARWAEYRSKGVITKENFAKLIYELVDQIGVMNYETEQKLWLQPGYRDPVYWRMPASALQPIYTNKGKFKTWGYDESVNCYDNMPAALKEMYDADPASVAYDATKQYLASGGTVDQTYCVVGSGANLHWYQCTVNCKGIDPTTAYTCSPNPASGGVKDSPKRTVEWFAARMAYLDIKFGYNPA